MPERWIPAAGPARGLAVAQLVNSLGDGAYYVCSALYFSQVVGLSAAQIGLGLTVAWGVGAVAGVPLGNLADRRGPRGTAVALAVATAVCVAAFLTVRSFLPFVLAACAYATAQCGLAAARQSLLAGLVGRGERTGVLAHLQSALNAGLALGAALGGLALHIGTAGAYLTVLALDAAAFAGCALLLARLPEPGRVTAPARKDGDSVPEDGDPAPVPSVLRDGPYALVAALNMVMLLRMPLISVAVPLWIAEHTAAPGWTVSALLVLNTGAVMLFQVRTAAAVRDLPSAVRTVRSGGVLMLVSCAVFAGSALDAPLWALFAVLLVAAGLQVWGEMRQSAGAWQISFDLAPAGRQGQYQGFFGAGVPVARMLGPLLLTTLIVTWGPPGWLVLGALFLGAGAAMGPAVRRAERDRPTAPVMASAGPSTPPSTDRTGPSTPPSTDRFRPSGPPSTAR
ncbi:MFS transporter [Streptomyces sp. PTY087I2]|uniref:MFS transporter n=1 Tax=Streptomyces sp. PTY087I2 TaxID=1819298 RepID=UPI000827DC42|nr:MFS transporter [Streptomyces sp. PTY087I2]OCC10894.1 Major Facilitator Superfamily protein [Streptomyces sp. PTY087I2]